MHIYLIFPQRAQENYEIAEYDLEDFSGDRNIFNSLTVTNTEFQRISVRID